MSKIKKGIKGGDYLLEGSSNISDEELTNIFKKLGRVRAAYSIKDLQGRSKNFGYVDFCDEETALKVLEIGRLRVKDKMVEVKPYTKKHNKGKGKEKMDSQNESLAKNLSIPNSSFFPNQQYQLPMFKQDFNYSYGWPGVVQNTSNYYFPQNHQNSFNLNPHLEINNYDNRILEKKENKLKEKKIKIENEELNSTLQPSTLRNTSLEVKTKNEYINSNKKNRSSTEISENSNMEGFKLMKKKIENEGLKNFMNYTKLINDEEEEGEGEGEEDEENLEFEKNLLNIFTEEDTMGDILIKNQAKKKSERQQNQEILIYSLRSTRLENLANLLAIVAEI